VGCTRFNWGNTDINKVDKEIVEGDSRFGYASLLNDTVTVK
jgi:hypothetical protein